MDIKEFNFIVKMITLEIFIQLKLILLRIEGASKLILTKYGPKAESLFQDDKILPYSIAISEALEEAKA